MGRFLPNECYVCKSRDNLRRCGCNMIYYCSEPHRLQHLPIHESFCKVIKELLKEKKVSHMYEELSNISDPIWSTKQREIHQKIEKKLKRKMSPLESFMFGRPRHCFLCSNTKDKDLINCPHCPVVSFCKKHPQNELHSMNCKVLNRYLNILKAAEELNIDMEFLSSTFPCITEEKVIQAVDELTQTYYSINMKEKCLQLRLLIVDLIDFMDVASKMNSALQKIHNTIPEELTIHINALSREHAITKNDYWEFLLHLNPQIKKLKVIITQTESGSNLKTSLCKNCITEKKEIVVEYLSKSYDDYMQDEIYQKPDILFYVKVLDECNSESLNKWSEFNCPTILRFDSKLNFCKGNHFLSLLTGKFRIVNKGKIEVPFGILSSIQNEDYFIILQSLGNKVHQKFGDTITHQCGQNTNGVEDASKTTQTHPSSESKDNSAKNENSNLETNDHSTSSTSHTESNKTVIEKENTNTNESPLSSKRSLETISEPGEEDEGKKNKKSKTENCKNCSKSIDKENFDPNCKEGKNTKENNVEKKNKEVSFVIGHVSYLENENESLRQQLNSAFKEITKLQTKFDHVCLELNKKETVIKNLLSVIVDSKNTDSVCEENKM